MYETCLNSKKIVNELIEDSSNDQFLYNVAAELETEWVNREREDEVNQEAS